MAEYLNLDGLKTLWAKLKDTFALKKHSHTVEDIPVDSALSSTSTNPVQNKVVNTALAGKSATSHAHGYISNTGGLEGTDGSYNVRLTGSRIVDSPAAKYLWHDILAFGRHVGWPSFEQTADGVNWEEKTLSKIPFLQKDGTGITVINASNKGARWTWNSGNFGYCGASWLFVGIGYGGDGVKNTTIQVHTSSDGTTWYRRHLSVISNHQRPYLFKVVDAGKYKYLRITLLMEDLSLTSYASVVIQAIKFVTTRWGSQGAGREYEFPYNWDENCNIIPIENNTKNLGSSSAKWANIYATNFNGALKGNADTATKALALCRNNTTRQTSINLAHESGGAGNALMRVDLVSSAISTANGKPGGDGFVITMNWDSQDSYDTQIYIPCSSDTTDHSGIPQIRFKDNQSEWGAWGEISIGGNAATASFASTSGVALINSQNRTSHIIDGVDYIDDAVGGKSTIFLANGNNPIAMAVNMSKFTTDYITTLCIPPGGAITFKNDCGKTIYVHDRSVKVTTVQNGGNYLMGTIEKDTIMYVWQTGSTLWIARSRVADYAASADYSNSAKTAESANFANTSNNANGNSFGVMKSSTSVNASNEFVSVQPSNASHSIRLVYENSESRRGIYDSVLDSMILEVSSKNAIPVFKGNITGSCDKWGGYALSFQYTTDPNFICFF